MTNLPGEVSRAYDAGIPRFPENRLSQPVLVAGTGKTGEDTAAIPSGSGSRLAGGNTHARIMGHHRNLPVSVTIGNDRHQP